LFERKGSQFMPPQQWPAEAVAMTTTHDLPTMTGWWRGADIDTRDKIGLIADKAAEQTTRDKERRMLWRAFRRSNSASGKAPAQTEPLPVADAAARFIAQIPSALALLPLEDALALDEQTNVPGTVNEYPNWRRRYPGRASDLLAAPDVKRRLEPLAARERR
jgi:4-alpha-glucanotransferase